MDFMKCDKREEKRCSSKKLTVLLVLFILLFVFFGVKAISEFINLNQSQNEFKKLAASVMKAAIQESDSKANSIEESSNILPQYRELSKIYPDLYGWIKIDDTLVNYPVMHTPNDPEKYLRKNMEGKYSIMGTIFMDYRCSEKSDSEILYGHYMKNGTMFGSILNYKNESYWKEHPIIQFDTIYRERKYEVMSAFYDQVYMPEETCFKYYNFIDAVNRKEYEQAIHYYQKKSLYDTGVKAEYGDKLLVLSTCSYHVENGRFVVVAREKIENSDQ